MDLILYNVLWIMVVILIIIWLIPYLFKKKNNVKIFYVIYAIFLIAIISFDIIDFDNNIKNLKSAAELLGGTLKQSKINELILRFIIDEIIKIFKIIAGTAIGLVVIHYSFTIFIRKNNDK